MTEPENGTGDVPCGAGGRPGISAADIVDSRVLLRSRQEILIRHGTELYRLRSTSKGKLILTK